MCPTGWAVPTDQGAQYRARPDEPDLPHRRAAAAARYGGHDTRGMTLDVRIHDILARLATVCPDRVGATLGDEARTFGDLDTGATRAAHRLAAAGVTVGDRVTWWGPTAFETLDVGYGTSKLGAAIAPINPNFTEPEAASALEVLQPRVVVAHPEHEDVARAVAAPMGLDVLVTSRRMVRRCIDGRAATRREQRGREQRLPHQWIDRRVQGCGALAPVGLAARRQRDVEEGATGRRGTVVMFGLFHMAGLVLHRERDGRRPRRAPRPQRRSRGAPRRGRAMARRRALLHPRRLATHPRVRRPPRHVVARRRCSPVRRWSAST